MWTCAAAGPAPWVWSDAWSGGLTSLWTRLLVTYGVAMRHVVMRDREAVQRECAHKKPEIAKGDVEVAGHQEQVDDDAGQPKGDDKRPNPWFPRDQQASH